MDKIKLFLAHVFSWHTLVTAVGLGIAFTATNPALAQWHTLLLAIGGLVGATGFGMASASDPAKMRARAGITDPTIELPDGASLRALLPLAFLALSLSACAGAKVWGACTLGQLPQIAQPAIPAIVSALEQPDSGAAISAVESVGLGLLPGQISCIVQAIAADEEARATAAPARMSPRAVRVLSNARTFLGKHPATACADTWGAL